MTAVTVGAIAGVRAVIGMGSIRCDDGDMDGVH